VGQVAGGLAVQPTEELEQTLRQRDIRIAIVAVPSAQAQEVIDLLVKCNIRAIVNYAPVAPRVPDGVKVRNIDPVLAMQSMTFYLRTDRPLGGGDLPPRSSRPGG
jgi:redox-sensing transcriptional repressor